MMITDQNLCYLCLLFMAIYVALKYTYIIYHTICDIDAYTIGVGGIV